MLQVALSVVEPPAQMVLSPPGDPPVPLGFCGTSLTVAVAVEAGPTQVPLTHLTV